MLTLLHISDLHFGPPYVPRVGEAVQRLAAGLNPGAVVVSGDLTQRAKQVQFAEAREFLDRLGNVPLVVVPGNHDVPLYRTLERLTTPYRNWRRFSGRPELDTVTHIEGATFVALSSAAPRRAVVAGRLRSRQLQMAHRAFREAPMYDHRIVVVHHHFVPVPGGGAGRPLAHGAALLRELEDMGVSAVLGGHVHQLHMRVSSDLTGRPRPFPVISTGTATSTRGRGDEAGWNSLCVHRFGEGSLVVTPYVRGPRMRSFEPKEARTFELGARGAVVPGRPADQGAGGP